MDYEQFLQRYLDRLKAQEVKFEPGSDLDPKNLALDRTQYEFRNLKDGRRIVLIGTSNQDNQNARNEERLSLEERFKLLYLEPNNINELTKYAEELIINKYYEHGEKVLGKALVIYDENPKIYHLLAEINQIAGDSKKGLHAKKHHVLSWLLAERGLQIIDITAAKLIDDVLAATGSIPSHEKYKRYYQRLDVHYSLKFEKRD